MGSGRSAGSGAAETPTLGGGLVVGGLGAGEMHLAADGRCRPLCFVLTPGQAGDASAFGQVMATIRVPRPVGRPRVRPDAVLADKAYSSRAVVQPLPQAAPAHARANARLVATAALLLRIGRVSGK
ncbi:hypothetical protein GCM10010507_19700 [Streptomyces cinnamoneus]|uniref:Transposase IS4-like domain-containing protein n=1 Tax=Streptomyces cinnamoneus TaxID=53446 RepID=A0A918TEY2_STRCJ|nr:hypothetical protein GCM10010507_19700 [Streptomyces cinnamoneus]